MAAKCDNRDLKVGSQYKQMQRSWQIERIKMKDSILQLPIVSFLITFSLRFFIGLVILLTYRLPEVRS